MLYFSVLPLLGAMLIGGVVGGVVGGGGLCSDCRKYAIKGCSTQPTTCSYFISTQITGKP